MAALQDTVENKGADRRAWERLQLAEPVSVLASSGSTSYRCMIEDVSFGGACLRVGSGVPTKANFYLNHPLAGRFAVERMWRDGDRIGVRFKQPRRRHQHLLQCLCIMLHPDAEIDASQT
jgi:hypothetical protein